MKKQMHLAAQYLAAAGISFLKKEADDSHTNLGFSTENGCLYTHPLSKNDDMLCLDYERFVLDWKSDSGHTSFRLDGASHKDILKWLTDVSKTFLNKQYSYKFHYELPYSVKDMSNFKLYDVGKVQELMHQRILAQFAIRRILSDNNLESSIRVWPHHFDTAAYANFEDTENKSVGFGLAIPDDLCQEHYLYMSGYKDGEVINPSVFENLKNGLWKTENFKGAILPVSKITEADAVTFFQEAMNHFKNIE